MTHRVSVCWPSCLPELITQLRNYLKKKKHKEYSIDISDSGTEIDSILLQTYPIELLDKANCDMNIYSEKRSAVLGNNDSKKLICFSYASSKIPEFARKWADDMVHHAEGEKADRLAMGIEHPLLEIEPVSKKTCEMIEQIVKIRTDLVKLNVNDALFIGDVAMACYGIRKAREDKIEVILTKNIKLTKSTSNYLKENKISYSFLDTWLHDNGVLKHYHGIDITEIADPKNNKHVFFMGLMIPTREMSFLISRARIGSYDSDTPLLDSIFVKPSSYGSVLPCVFGDSYDAAFAELEYNKNLFEKLKSYKKSTSDLLGNVCQNINGDYGFAIKESTADSDKELEKTNQLHEKLRGMPVFAMYYGLIKCQNGKNYIAMESSDYTLSDWSNDNHLMEDWLEVLARVTWGALVLENHGLQHKNLTSSNIVLRIAHGESNKRKPVPIKLNDNKLHLQKWDIRFIGVGNVEQGSNKKALQSLGRSLEQSINNNDVFEVLNQMMKLETKQFSSYLSKTINQRKF